MTPEAFVRAATTLQHVGLVPELTLRLAADPTGIFAAAEAVEHDGERLPPYWAFAWPGGQGMARFLLDHPGEVAGRSVVDIGAGSGIAAVAAARSGAKSVLAADIDPLAEAAIRLNAADNGVTVATTTRDVLGSLPACELVLIGDLVYEPALATRVAAFLQAAARAGRDVLLADRSTARRPPVAFDFVAEHDAPLTPSLPAHAFERSRIWRLAGSRAEHPRKSAP